MTNEKRYAIVILSGREKSPKGVSEMNEIRNGNKAIRKVANMIFYGQYINYANGTSDFQVLDAKEYTERKLENMKKKYGF